MTAPEEMGGEGREGEARKGDWSGGEGRSKEGRRVEWRERDGKGGDGKTTIKYLQLKQ